MSTNTIISRLIIEAIVDQGWSKNIFTLCWPSAAYVVDYPNLYSRLHYILVDLHITYVD